jgi:transposase
VLDANTLPNDVAILKRLLIERDREVEHLKLQLARLRRWKFGHSSEQLPGTGQLPLSLEELAAAIAEIKAGTAEQTSPARGKPVRRKKLPEHFERIDELIESNGCRCPQCGGTLQPFGTADEAEVLEAKTVTFTVRRQIRPKKRCPKCSTIVQAPAPPRPIEKSFAGASLLALILSWKYGFHVPLYRQCQIFAQAGLTISRTTLMQWVGASSRLLAPLSAALGRYVLTAANLNADDTPVKVLAPGKGKTKRGRLWTYVRDGRPWKSRDPPAVWYQYSPNWRGVYPQKHLAHYRGKLQVDAYAGFDALFEPTRPGESPRIVEIACAAHMRRKFFELYTATGSALAKEALDRFGDLYRLETELRGRSPEERLAARKAYAVPKLEAFRAWMLKRVGEVERKSEIAGALQYSLKNWEALVRYTEDGRLGIDNNPAERSIRGIGVGRRNYLFFGSDSGGERAAIIYALIETCKLNGIDPQRYLEYVLERIAEHPINRIEELLPWNVIDKLDPSREKIAA